MNLLIVEDDKILQDFLLEHLRSQNYAVECCSSISELDAYLSISENDPEIVLLDRMLSDGDGATLIRKIKKYYPNTKIVVLSAIDLPTEKANIIDIGADEYLSKPFSMEELTARIRLVLRRGKSDKNDFGQINFSNLTLNIRNQIVKVDSQKLDLTRKEFQTLLLLLEYPGRVWSKIQLLERIWEVQTDVESNVVETMIRNLRRKLELAGSQCEIKSRRNVGYWVET